MRLTKALFYLSDALAWLIAAIAVVIAVAFPFVAPVMAEMDNDPIPPIGIIIITAAFASIALGAWLLTRRKLIGVAIVSLPAILGTPWFFLTYMLFIGTFFCLPFALAFVESSNLKKHNGET